MAAREVEIIVTKNVVGSYEARSYPNDQTDTNGFYPLYRVPLYQIAVTGKDDNQVASSSTFIAPRFMPYFNDPHSPSSHYKAMGWIVSGLSHARRVVISTYLRHYAVQNRFSPGRGAIVVYQHFYIHAGPASLDDSGFGSAGCIEVIGDWELFKQAIVERSGLQYPSADSVIEGLVRSSKLVVLIEAAVPPGLRIKNFTRKVRF